MPTTAYFSTPERLAALTAAGQAWIGTPFAHNGIVCGPQGGVSCHGLVVGVLAEAGWSLGEAFPTGQAGHARHSRLEVMLPWLRARPEKFAEISPVAVGSLLPGDITTHRLGLCSHHVALVLPGAWLLEVWSGRVAGVRSLVDADATKRLTGIFRPLAAS